MSLDRVCSGVDCPHDIYVIVEIPSHSDPVKYEVDVEMFQNAPEKPHF